MPEHGITIRVRYHHTDQSGAVYHANYVQWFEAARAEAMRAGGIPYSELEASGVQLPVVDLHARYLRPARYDDLLEVWARVAELGRVRVKFEYRIVRSTSGELLATGHTVHASTDPSGRVLRMDRLPDFWDRIQRAAGPLQAGSPSA